MVTRVCRSILLELKKSSPRSTHEVINNETWIYIKDTLRKDKPSTNHTVADLQNYLHYLTSSRNHTELLSKYQGRGERSIEDSARLVGLLLPDVHNIDEQESSQKEKIYK